MTGKGRLVVLAVATFAVGTDGFVVAGLLPGIAASLRVNAALAGQLVTAYALTYALASPVMAAATGQWPRRRVLQCGLASAARAGSHAGACMMVLYS